MRKYNTVSGKQRLRFPKSNVLYTWILITWMFESVQRRNGCFTQVHWQGLRGKWFLTECTTIRVLHAKVLSPSSKDMAVSYAWALWQGLGGKWILAEWQTVWVPNARFWAHPAKKQLPHMGVLTRIGELTLYRWMQYWSCEYSVLSSFQWDNGRLTNSPAYIAQQVKRFFAEWKINTPRKYAMTSENLRHTFISQPAQTQVQSAEKQIIPTWSRVLGLCKTCTPMEAARS